MALAIVRRNFINLFPREDRDVAKFLSNLLEPNCAIDEAMTQKLRDKRTADVWVVCNFEPGQIVAHRGEVIDRKIKTAIDQLKDKAVVGKLQELQAKQQTAVGQLQQIVAENNAKGAQAQQHRALAGGRAGGDRFGFGRSHLATGATKAAGDDVAGSGRRHGGRLATARPRGRATHGEVAKCRARAGLISHLQQWFSRMLTQRLISQRRMLLETHDNAAAGKWPRSKTVCKRSRRRCKSGWRQI